MDSDYSGALGIESVSDPLISLVNKEKVQTANLNELNKSRFAAWTSYDVANTFYASGILSFTSLVYILVIGQRNGLSYGTSLFYYNSVLTIASVIMAFLLPILGSLSDVTQQRKNFVLVFTTICIISTYLFIILDSFWAILIVFAISMITYQWAQVFYDAMLPGIVPPGKEARLSSIAITLGYLGGAVITLFAFYLSLNGTDPNANPDDGAITLGYSEPMIIAVIIGFTLFAIPIFFIKETNWEEVSKLVFLDDLDEWEHIYDAFLGQTDEEHEHTHFIPPKKGYWKIAKESITELWGSFKDIQKNNRGMFYYIIAYFIIADLANLMAIINVEYLRTGVGLDEGELFIMIWISGMSLLIFTPVIGLICDKKGAKTGFLYVGALWFISLGIMIFQGVLIPEESIYIAAVAFGPASSGVWVAQRQMVFELVPSDEEIGTYFGLTKFSGKLSSAIGPLLFSIIFIFVETRYNYLPDYTQLAYRVSIAALTVLLAVGFWVLIKYVPDKSTEFKERKKRIADALESTGKEPDYSYLDI